MKIPRTRRAIAGTTLVEVVMATFLLGIMASGIIGSFTYGFRVMQLVRENQRATQILLEKVETIRLYNWDQVNTSGFIPQTFEEDYDPQAPEGSKGAAYAGTVVIEPVTSTASYSTNLRQLTVTLQWQTGQIPHTRTITTLIAKDGLQNYVY